MGNRWWEACVTSHAEGPCIVAMRTAIVHIRLDVEYIYVV